MSAERSLPLSARAFLSVVVTCGFGILLWGTRGALDWSREEVLAWIAISGLTAITERFYLHLRHGSETENVSETDVVWTAGLMLCPPDVLLLGAAIGCVIGQVVRRWALVKITFNVGQYTIALAAALAVYRLISPTSVLEARTWIAAAIAMAVYFVINELTVATIIALVEGRSVPSVTRPLLFLSTIHWGSNVSIGLLAAVVWVTHPAALALVIVPLSLSYVAHRAWLRSMKERDRMGEIARTAEMISLERDMGRRVSNDEAKGDVEHLARTFNLMLDRLEDGFRRERLFINEASHELRTPITICIGYLELVNKNSSPEEIDEALSVVTDELDRMTRMVEELTMLARVEDPEFARLEEVELERFMRVLASKTAPLAGTRLKIHPALENEVVRVDPQRLIQALINLIRNAVVHTNHSSAIEVRVRALKGAWRFEVCDWGGGLPPDQEERIFEPFCRVDQRKPGSGLGLAIVRGIAKAHGGRAGVDNRPGDGATFWISLPR